MLKAGLADAVARACAGAGAARRSVDARRGHVLRRRLVPLPGGTAGTRSGSRAARASSTATARCRRAWTPTWRARPAPRSRSSRPRASRAATASWRCSRSRRATWRRARRGPCRSSSRAPTAACSSRASTTWSCGATCRTSTRCWTSVAAGDAARHRRARVRRHRGLGPLHVPAAGRGRRARPACGRGTPADAGAVVSRAVDTASQRADPARDAGADARAPPRAGVAAVTMRIAHLVATFPPYYAGSGNACFYQAEALAARGHAVEVFTASYPGVPHDPVGVRHPPLRARCRLGNAPFIPQLALIDGFDVIHLHQPFIFGAEAALAAHARSRHPTGEQLPQRAAGAGRSRACCSPATTRSSRAPRCAAPRPC